MLSSKLEHEIQKNEPYRTRSSFWFAEREGFEPPEPLSSTVFKTAAIDHSAISPSSECACRTDCRSAALGDRDSSSILEATSFSDDVFSKSGAKVLLFFELCKFFDTFFAYIEIL